VPTLRAVGGQVGSASVLVVGIVSATLVVAVAATTAERRGIEQVRAATTADSAALAGAAVAIGIGSAETVRAGPCAAAERIAASAGMAVDECHPERATVTVHVLSGSGAFAVGATARAGPPERVSYI
jgi:hypothetical protein